MALNILSNILKDPPTTPLVDYIFAMNFYDNYGNIIYSYEEKYNLPIKCDLPKFDTTIKTFKFFGTEKSFPIHRKHSGESNIEFYLHSSSDLNDFVNNNIPMAKDRIIAWDNKAAKENNFTEYIYNKFIHKEFSEDIKFKYIDLIIFNNALETEYIFRYVNCIIKNIDFGSVAYESNNILKCNMSFNYDDWFIY